MCIEFHLNYGKAIRETDQKKKYIYKSRKLRAIDWDISNQIAMKLHYKKKYLFPLNQFSTIRPPPQHTTTTPQEFLV